MQGVLRGQASVTTGRSSTINVRLEKGRSLTTYVIVALSLLVEYLLFTLYSRRSTKYCLKILEIPVLAMSISFDQLIRLVIILID